MSDTNDVQNDLMSFLDSEPQADSTKVEKTQKVEQEDFDTDEDSSTEDYNDGYDEDEHEDESTADEDNDNEDHEDDSDEDTDESTSEVEANDFNDKKIKVIIDGEEHTVTGSELKSGYMRQQAFTKKTQELAEQRKVLDAELTKTVQRSEAVKFNASIEMEKLDGILRQVGGWDGLRSGATPEQYDQFHQKYIQAKKDSDMADDILRETQNTMRESNEQTIHSIFKDMARTVDGFNSNTINEMSTFLTQRGFTDDMVLSMTSPEAWQMVFDAMKYNKLQSRTQETVKAEKKKSTEKTNVNAPVKKSDKGTSKSREIEKGLKKQRSSTGSVNNQITLDLLNKIL